MNGLRLHSWGIAAGFALAGGAAALSGLAFAQNETARSPAQGPSALPLIADAGGGSTAPDPAPIRTDSQYFVTFRYEAGRVSFLGARRVTLLQPRTTPRVAGRYAIELFSGPTLVERLRFDFPLLGADELAGKPREYNAPPRFETKAVVQHSVLVPNSSRISVAHLVDRATRRTWALAWPPDELADAGRPDARPDGRAADGGEAGRDAADAWVPGDVFVWDVGGFPIDARGPWFDARPLGP